MGNTYTNLVSHVVFSTKNREPLVMPSLREDLYGYIGGVVRNECGTLLEIGGMPDHVHLVAKIKPDVSVADMLRLVKCNSSKWANEQGDGHFAWQSGYSAFSVSESQVPVVRNYVREQERHHQKLSFQEELLRLLQKHGIQYDERFLWG